MGESDHRRSGIVAVAIMLVIAVAALALIVPSIRFDSPASGGARALKALDASIGATLEPFEPKPAGARAMIVTSVANGGPAERAGLRVGDLVEQIGPSPAGDVKASAASLGHLPAPVIVNRRGKRAIVQLAAGQR